MFQKIIWVNVLIILFLTGNVLADDAVFRTVVSRNDMSIGGQFNLDLQIQSTSGTSPRTLNSLTVDVYYGSQITATSATGWAFGAANGYTRTADILGGNYYRVLVTGGAVNENNTNPGTPAGWDVTTSWQNIVTLQFTINNLTSVNVSIDDGTDAAAYFDNHTNAPKSGTTAWNVTNQDLGDQSLPVQMGNIAATASAGEGIVLAWRTESETNSAGFHVWRSQSENGTYKPVTTSLMSSKGNGSSATAYKYVDKNVLDGNKYWYKIEEVSTDGKSEFFGPISVQGIPLPTEYSMAQNYPNPFNPETTIKYELPEVSEVSVNVYTLLGKEVKTLVNKIQNAGRYAAKWNGTGEDGKRVPSGIYFIRIQAGIFSQTRKMTFMQ